MSEQFEKNRTPGALLEYIRYIGGTNIWEPSILAIQLMLQHYRCALLILCFGVLLLAKQACLEYEVEVML